MVGMDCKWQKVTSPYQTVSGKSCEDDDFVLGGTGWEEGSYVLPHMNESAANPVSNPSPPDPERKRPGGPDFPPIIPEGYTEADGFALMPWNR